MGYTTKFTGRVTVTPALNPHEIGYLRQFASVRHMHRTKGPYVVADGGFVADQPAPDIVITGGRDQPALGLPGYWCKWAPSDDGSAIEWDQEEKFYHADTWMAYLIDTFLKPGATVARELSQPVPGWLYPEEFAHFTFDHVVDGTIEAEGEEEQDIWRLEVRDNTVYTIHGTVEPDHAEIDPARPSDWADEQWARFAAAIRHNVIFVVREGQLHEVDPAAGIVFDPVKP